MGLSDQDSEGSTLARRRSPLDLAIEEIYGRPQGRENFTARSSEVRKAMNLPVTKQLLERDRYVRRRIGMEQSSWFGRKGVSMDDLDRYIWEVAKNEGKKSKMRRSNMYASIFCKPQPTWEIVLFLFTRQTACWTGTLPLAGTAEA